ncbi:MAG TPA: GNAT family N-acetyltransferase, partial [Blastocatellia bacterium]|nr:GNAT family N-acetyltransferase [Blastocatellia bacterium]
MSSATITATQTDTQAATTEAARPAVTWPAMARDKFSVVSVSDFAALDGVIEKWDDLAAHAVELNPFYERATLRPALARVGAGVDLRVVLIFGPNPARPTQPLLCGLFPLERGRHKDVPCRTLRLWRFAGCHLATPLVRASHAQETMAAFFAWLASADHGCALMEFNRVSGEGPFHHLFVDYLDHNAVLYDARGCLHFDDDEQERVLRTVTVGTGKGRNDLIVSLLPLLRRLKAVSSSPALPRQRKMFAVTVEDAAELNQYASDWDALAESAIEPNVCYERWMLQPALTAFGQNRRLIFVLIFADAAAQAKAGPVLCGLFPLELSGRYDGLGKPLPLRTVSLWKHKHSFLCTPLVRAEGVNETIAAFFAWLDEYAHGAALMDFRYIPEGPFYRALAEHLDRTGRPHYLAQSFTRALLRPRDDAQAYLREALSREHRKDFRRKERRLAEGGALEYTALEATGDPRPWVEEFLRVEHSSWKGQQGSALLSTQEECGFFEAITTAAFARGRLMMLALRKEGRAIACKCNFIAGRGAYAFKIAYDPEHALASPGVLLEIENLRRAHANEGLDWMDSCADPSNAMINRLWL